MLKAWLFLVLPLLGSTRFVSNFVRSSGFVFLSESTSVVDTCLLQLASANRRKRWSTGVSISASASPLSACNLQLRCFSNFFLVVLCAHIFLVPECSSLISRFACVSAAIQVYLLLSIFKVPSPTSNSVILSLLFFLSLSATYPAVILSSSFSLRHYCTISYSTICTHFPQYTFSSCFLQYH